MMNMNMEQVAYHGYVIKVVKDESGAICAAKVTKDGKSLRCNDFYSIVERNTGTVIRGMSLDDEGIPRYRGRFIPRKNLGNMEILEAVVCDCFNYGSVR